MATVSDHKTINCPVCFRRYISPRELPCCHTLCEKCLDVLVTSQAGSGKECLCPLCNASIIPPDPELSVDKWAKAFPLNSLICSVLESIEVSDNGENICKSLESVEEYDHGENKCEPCKADGETTTADVWCTDCLERLCHDCDKLHKRMKPMKDHKTVPISEMEQEIQSPIHLDQNSATDPSNELGLFCVDHGKATEECKDDTARKQTRRSTPSLSSFVSDISELKTEMENVMSSRTNSLTEIKKEKNQIIREVDKRIDTIIAELDNFRNEFKSDTDQVHQEAENSLLKNQKMVQSFLTNIENSEEILEVVEKKGSSEQKFITLENVTSQLTSHYEQLKTCLEGDMEVHLRLEHNVLDDIEDAATLNPQQEQLPSE